MSILQKAFDRVSEAEGEYGQAAGVYGRVADLWSAYLKKRLKAKDVCMMMILLKLGRESGKHKTDNLTDIVGYAELIWQIEQEIKDVK